jgi:hypothetical protein
MFAFAHECWLICRERWPKGSCLRTDRWPIHARVCKPEGYCSQAATPTWLRFKREHGLKSVCQTRLPSPMLAGAPDTTTADLLCGLTYSPAMWVHLANPEMAPTNW